MTEHKTINELVNDALIAWGSVTRTDPTKQRFTLGDFNDEFGGRKLITILEELNASRDLDPSGITTFMMLRGYTERYLAATAFTAAELILEPQKVESEITAMRALRDSLENPQVVEVVSNFEQSLRGATAHYGVTNQAPFEELFADKLDLALLRRDALRSLNTLRAFQFTQGEGSTDPLKYGKKIYEFWNINSVLAAMRGQRVPGIMLCLLRDPVALHSYFAFAVANGGTITILTDQEEYAHPEQKNMSRRPDKMLAERAGRNWFPYHLLDIEVSEDQRALYARARTALVPMNAEAVAVANVSDLPPAYFVWTTLMFELIRERYWTQNHLLPELSYTASMIETPDELVGEHASLVRTGAYKPLTLPRLTAADVTTETVAMQWPEAPSAHNQWLVDRYINRVPDDILNITGEAKKLLITGRVEKNVFQLAQTPGTALLPPIPAGHFEGQLLRHSYKFVAQDPTTFGTAAEVARDRVWVARHNQMRAVQRFVDDEFAASEKNLRKWCQERLKANQEFLLDAAVRGELVVPTTVHIRQWAEPEQKPYWTNHLAAFTLDGEIPGRRTPDRMCYVRADLKSSIYTKFTPTCPEALAALFGVELGDLPWQLRHWTAFEPRTGNHILDRVDPIDWALKNPWNDLKMDVKLCLSRTSFNERRKALGLPRKEWPVEKET